LNSDKTAEPALRIRKKLFGAARSPRDLEEQPEAETLIDSTKDEQNSKLMKKEMRKARNEIQNAFKNVCHLVRDQMDDPANKTLLNISPIVPLTLMMKPYIREFFQIELNGK
jgi:hypothetical protein